MLLVLIGEFADEEMNQEVDDGNENSTATGLSNLQFILRPRSIQVDLETDDLGAGADGRHNSDEQIL